MEQKTEETKTILVSYDSLDYLVHHMMLITPEPDLWAIEIRRYLEWNASKIGVEIEWQ